MRNARGHLCKVNMSGSEKKKSQRERVRHFLHKKRVTKKFLKVLRCSRAIQWQRNVLKKGAARAKLLFC